MRRLNRHPSVMSHKGLQAVAHTHLFAVDPQGLQHRGRRSAAAPPTVTAIRVRKLMLAARIDHMMFMSVSFCNSCSMSFWCWAK